MPGILRKLIQSRSLGARLARWLTIAALVAAAQAAPPVRTTAEVRALPAARAAQGLPVELKAIVTYHDPTSGDFFVQDSTGAIYVETAAPIATPAGARVTITGVTAADFTNDIRQAAIVETGIGPRPEPRVLPLGRLVSGAEDCAFVVTTGRVRSAYIISDHSESRLEMRLEDAGRSIGAQVLNYAGLSPDSLTGATVRVTGVSAGHFNDRKQLIGSGVRVQSAADVVIVRPATPAPFSLALCPIDRLLASGRGLPVGRRGHVAGVVTCVQSGRSLVVQEGNAPLQVHTRQSTPVSPGDRVEVTGFLAFGDYSAVFEDANYRVIGGHAELSAMVVPPGGELNGAFDSKLVSIQAELTGVASSASRLTLVVKAGGALFPAVLEATVIPAALANLPPGTLLRVTGVCFVEARGVFRGAHGYRMVLRSPDDIRVIRLAPWWTADRLLYGAGGLLILVIAAVAWGATLRMRVRAQTAEMQRVLEARAIREERIAAIREARAYVLERINSREPLASVLGSVARLVESFFSGAIGYVHLLATNGDLELAASSRPDAALQHRLQRIPAQTSAELCARAVRENQLVVLEGSPAACACPIHSANHKLLGTVSVDFPGGRPADPLTPLMETGSQLAALAIENRRLYESLEYQALHDALTGLPNRTLLDVRLGQALESVRSPGDSISAAYLDLDGFKWVNDRYGHAAGDVFLQKAAQRLLGAVREGDTVARIGGDEFMVISRGVHSRSEAVEICSRLRAALAEPLDLGGGLCLPCSASIGVALFPDDAHTMEDLKRSADRAMYAAKSGGKGRRVTDLPVIQAG